MGIERNNLLHFVTNRKPQGMTLRVLFSNARAFRVHFIVLLLSVCSPIDFANFLFLKPLSYAGVS